MATNHQSRSGQVVILSALLVIALCAVAALVIDVGSLFLSRARLQNTADAASKAALLELWEQRGYSEDEDEAAVAGQLEAVTVADMNYSQAGLEVVFGSWEGSQFTPSDADTSVPVDAVWVRAFRDPTAPGGPDRTFFASMFGLDKVNISASATARLRLAGMVPFGIYEDDVVPIGETLTMYDDEEVVPGCFGLLDFDGGDHSAEEGKYWTRYGYYGPFDFNPEPGYVLVEGTTGLKTSLKAGVSYRISEGDVVIACIYDEVSGKASNATFRLVGLIALVITEHVFTDASENEYDHLKAEVVSTHYFSSGLGTDMRRNFMRLQLVE